MAAIGVLALALSACSSSPVERRVPFEADGLPSVDVRIVLQADHQHQADRYQHAATVALRMIGEWLVPFPSATLTLVDPPFRAGTFSPPADEGDAVVLERDHWWTAPAAMAPELAVARGISRRYWERVIDSTALPPWFIAGLAEYTARRVVARLSDELFLFPFRSRAEARFFDGFVSRDTRVQLRPEDEGDPVPAYRASPHGGPPAAREAKVLLTLGTLERWIGRPALDDVLLSFIHVSAGGRPTVADFRRVAGERSQQDLSWLFDETLDGSGVFDYAVSALESVVEPDGRYRTRVVVRRLGDAVFSGVSRPPSPAFERGRGIVVRTTFADAESVLDAWDGRSREKAFEYLSAARAVSAQVDPGRVLLLDLNRTNNSRTLAPASRSAATRWAGRWLLWLEDALLTCASLI